MFYRFIKIIKRNYKNVNIPEIKSLFKNVNACLNKYIYF